MTIELRQATPQDAHRLAELMDIGGEGIPAYLWSESAGPGLDPLEFGAQRVAGTDDAFSYRNAHVALVDDSVAGMLLGYRLDDPYETGDLASYPAVVRPLIELEAQAPGSWYINAIAVYGGYRGRGVATRLLQLAETLAAEAGATRVSLIVAEENAAAKRLYDKLGYHTIAVRPIVPCPGFPHAGDWLLMEKRLR